MSTMKYPAILKKVKDMIWMDQKVLSPWFILGKTYWQLELTLLLLGCQKQKYGTYFGKKSWFWSFQKQGSMFRKTCNTIQSSIFLWKEYLETMMEHNQWLFESESNLYHWLSLDGQQTTIMWTRWLASNDSTEGKIYPRKCIHFNEG